MEVDLRGRLKVSEQAILNDIWEYALLSNLSVVHVRNTGAIIKRDGRTFFGKPKFDQKGASDLIVVVRGVPLACEVKAAAGRVSHEQYLWLERWRKNGGRTIIARCLEDFIAEIVSIQNGGNENGNR
jgi:hypothetical protein